MNIFYNKKAINLNKDGALIYKEKNQSGYTQIFKFENIFFKMVGCEEKKCPADAIKVDILFKSEVQSFLNEKCLAAWEAVAIAKHLV